MADFLFNTYSPDVLLCLANLSNDEVLTPPDIANAMLDMLPQELFRNPDAKFLDPACKSGVFLREIAKRLIAGLKDTIPDLRERINLSVESNSMLFQSLNSIILKEISAFADARISVRMADARIAVLPRRSMTAVMNWKTMPMSGFTPIIRRRF